MKLCMQKGKEDLVNIKWNAEEYTRQFSFVHQYGEGVLDLMDAPEGSFVVDLGCGNGALTEKLQTRGYEVLGLDASSDMTDLAKKLHPELPFQTTDALEFSLDKPADVIFSNAVFHWIDEENQTVLAANLARNLKKGGSLVCEFGGKGCGEKVHQGLARNFEKRGLSYVMPFYFPTIGEYAPILEKSGFRVEYALLFDRPTKQQGEDGLKDWMEMFVKKPFEGIEESLKEKIIRETVEDLRKELHQDGSWYVDYVRIRIKAVKK